MECGGATDDRSTTRPALGVVVIGHVNHGKTALVRALTGMETDRLKEEVARGLSITLGFAWRDYPGGVVDFIDAPGHEDFIRAMAMGAAGARGALLVVSGVEGFGRQTREHLRIAELLGVAAGIVAVTKSDLLTDEALASVAEGLAAELDGTFLAGAPTVFCSARTGQALDALHGRLADLVARSPPPRDRPAFLPLDRVFSVAGAGTVVTGSLQGGPLAVDDTMTLQPSGRSVVLRQLQVHGRAVERIHLGGRAAAALRGVAAQDVAVGDLLCAPDAYEPSLLVDVELTLSPDAARPLRSADEVRVLWGARQDLAMIRLLGPNVLAPGERGFAQLRFRSPTIAYAGQRGVLRRPSPAETLGGVVVLDPLALPIRGRVEARRHVLNAAASGDLEAIVDGLARLNGGTITLDDAARLSRRPSTDVREQLSATFEALAGGVLVARVEIRETERRYLERLAEAHGEAPTRTWVSVTAVRARLAPEASSALVAHVERRLATSGAIRLSRSGVALAGHDPRAALSPAALARLDRIEQAYRSGGVTPPGRTELPDPSPDDPLLLDLLVDSGRLVSLRNVALRQTLVFHAEALSDASTALRATFPPPTGFTTGEARAALSTSRKFIVPMLEHLDTLGATLREGDFRRLTEVENRFDVPPDAF